MKYKYLIRYVARVAVLTNIVHIKGQKWAKSGPIFYGWVKQVNSE